MKKHTLSLFILLFINQIVCSQTINEVFEYAKEIKGAEVIKVAGVKLSMLKLVSGKGELPKGLSAIEAINCKNSKTDKIEELKGQIENIENSVDHETLVKTKEDNQSTLIMLERGDKETINQIVVFISKPTEVTLLRLKGKFKDSDISEMLNKKKEEKNKKE